LKKVASTLAKRRKNVQREEEKEKKEGAVRYGR
jgi:hypothetical protein